MKRKIDQQMLDAMSKDPGNWKGLIYINRKDPRIIVPKLNPSMGSTLNFACPYTYITFIAIILILVAAKYLIS